MLLHSRRHMLGWTALERLYSGNSSGPLSGVINHGFAEQVCIEALCV